MINSPEQVIKLLILFNLIMEKAMSFIKFIALENSSEHKQYLVNENHVVNQEVEIDTDWSSYYQGAVHIALITFYLVNGKTVTVRVVEEVNTVTRDEFISHVDNSKTLNIDFYQTK